MCSDDNDNIKTKAEYLPPQSRDVAKRDNKPNLPDPPLPSTGVVRSAFFTAVRYRGMAAAVAAYTSAVNRSVEAVNALADLDKAVLEHERASRQLDDAETIHKRDVAKRKQKLLNAEQNKRNAEAAAAKADMERERELSSAEAKHQRWQGKETGEGSSINLDDLSKEEKEYYDELKAVTTKQRFDLIAQAVIEEFLAGRSENQLTPDEQEYIRQIRKTADQLSKDREPFRQRRNSGV